MLSKSILHSSFRNFPKAASFKVTNSFRKEVSSTITHAQTRHISSFMKTFIETQRPTSFKCSLLVDKKELVEEMIVAGYSKRQLESMSKDAVLQYLGDRLKDDEFEAMNLKYDLLAWQKSLKIKDADQEDVRYLANNMLVDTYVKAPIMTRIMELAGQDEEWVKMNRQVMMNVAFESLPKRSDIQAG